MGDARLSKGEKTREALMDAGFAVFAEKGFLRTQIGDVVRAAGKSTGVFHIYFANKEALLDAWLDRCDGSVPWYHADTDLLFEKARPFILDSYWSLYDRFGPILEAVDVAAQASEHFANRWGDLRGKGDASIAATIRHGQAQGRFLGLDPDLTAVSIGAMIARTTAHWFQNRAQFEGRGLDRASLVAHLDRLYARMIDADGGAEIEAADLEQDVGRAAASGQ